MLSPVAIVLAAGKGTRMKSDLPKVLFPVCGRPMIEYVLDALAEVGVRRVVVVVGYRADLVREKLTHWQSGGTLTPALSQGEREKMSVEFVEQSPQLGTGHAVMVCRPALSNHTGQILILTGDTPLVQPATLRAMFTEFERTRPACLMGTAIKQNPAGLGRVVRDAAGNFVAIVEEKDATPVQIAIHEVNMSYYLFDSRQLWHALDRTRNENAQGEYYITDCPGILKAEGKDVRALCALAACETLSVNTVDELAEVEAELINARFPTGRG
ncbi:MAG TPA: NTP transferase domain-containing protein [Pirellulales bacterium]|nr:NTP transferase domain-containing protein [Pirellulales bacterium]